MHKSFFELWDNFFLWIRNITWQPGDSMKTMPWDKRKVVWSNENKWMKNVKKQKKRIKISEFESIQSSFCINWNFCLVIYAYFNRKKPEFEFFWWDFVSLHNLSTLKSRNMSSHLIELEIFIKWNKLLNQNCNLSNRKRVSSNLIPLELKFG